MNRVILAAVTLMMLAGCASVQSGRAVGPNPAVFRNADASSTRDFARWDVCAMLGSTPTGTLPLLTEDTESEPAGGCEQEIQKSNQYDTIGEMAILVGSGLPSGLTNRRVITGVPVWDDDLADADSGTCNRVMGSNALTVSVAVDLSVFDPSLPTACQIADAVVLAGINVIQTAPHAIIRTLPERSLTDVNLCGALDDTLLPHRTPFDGEPIARQDYDTACVIRGSGVYAYLSVSFGQPIDGTPTTVNGHLLTVNTYAGSNLCEDSSTQQQLPSSPDHEVLVLQVAWLSNSMPAVCKELPTDLAALLTYAGLK